MDKILFIGSGLDRENANMRKYFDELLAAEGESQAVCLNYSR